MANSDLIGSLVRAMDILKLIGKSPSGIRVNDICTALNLKSPTVYNMVRTLSAGGFVERRGGQLYLGREFKGLAGGGSNPLFTAEVEAQLFSLYQRIPRGTTIFGIATRLGIEQTHRISFDRPGVIQNLPNELMHPYATAAGLVGLAFADKKEFLLQNEKWPFAEFGAHLWETHEQLEAFLEQVRETKIAVSPFDRALFLRLSGAVTDRNGVLHAVVGVSIPSAHLAANDETVVEKEVRKSMHSLSKLLRQQS